MTQHALGRRLAAACILMAACGPLHAQSPTVLYGRVDLNLTSFSGPAPLEMTTRSTSRWGLRGSHAVGGDLHAIFQLEARINADTGTVDAKYWGRESWVGLRGRLGTLRLGRSQTPSQRIASHHDPHGTDGIGSFGAGGLLIGHSALTRMDNSVYYETPNLAGWSAFVAHRLDESPGGAGDPATSLRLRWQRGAWDLSLGHASSGRADAVASLGAAFDLGWVLPMAQHHRGERAGRRLETTLLGFTAPAAQGSWRAAWSQRADRGPAPATRQLVAAGYDHRLSARTTLYGTVAHDRTRGQGGQTGLELGIRHGF